MAQFIRSRLLSGLLAGVSPARYKLRCACLIMAVAALILALARPQWGFDWQEVKQRGVDIIVAIDTSKSMLAQDIPPNRLARAKLAALDIMQQAKSDRLGVVAFAGTAFLQCPLTIDDVAFRQSIESLDVNVIPQGGTALAEAIETASTAFKEIDNHRVLVLMSDGEDQEPGAAEAAKKAAAAGMRIYTIGIGTDSGDLLRTKDSQNHEDYVRDEQGNVVKSHLNEKLLQEIATEGGGFYIRLSGAKTIDQLFQHSQGIASLPKSEHQEKLVKQYHERYHWPLAVAIFLLLLEMLMPERARFVQPRAVTAPSPKPTAPVAALLLVLLLPSLALGSPSSALRDYKAGKYDQALKEYEKLLQKKSDDPRLHFNAGTAAYREGKYDEALKHFQEALAAQDLKLQELAYFNRGNTYYSLGEKSLDPSQRTASWENALKDYESSLKLNPQDTDARFNHEFVKKRLEELKQQQQQQQQQSKQDKNDQQKDPNQDQQQQQQQQNQEKKSDQNKQNEQQQAQQNQRNQKQNEQPQQQQQAAQQKKEEEKKQPAKPDQEKQDQQQQPQAAAQKQQEEEQERENAEAYAAGRMTPEQALRLLDSQKGEEMLLTNRPDLKPRDPTRPIRDW